jgi:pimeloyl-ACP methyl ester carboxylesterase
MEPRKLEVWNDGRRLLAEVVGPEDGPVLFWHGGTPACRRLPRWWYEEGTDRGLLHVSYSRPGYEGSDRMAGRSVADCVADTVAFADALGAESFYVLGSSGGGPHALACAAQVPERVRAAASVSGIGHPDAADLDWSEGMAKENLDELAELRRGDDELERFIRKEAAAMREIDTREKLLAGAREGDLHCQADLDVLDGRLLEFQLSTSGRAPEEVVWGWFDDEKAMWGSDWGFDPNSIEVPLSIWHGEMDRMVPAGHGEWLARRLPGAKFHLIPDEGHISIIDRYYGAMLDDLLAAAPR